MGELRVDRRRPEVRVALDTSVAVPFVMVSHVAHELVRDRLGGSEVLLTAHSLAETYSVLTRLSGDARLAPLDAGELIDANFAEVRPLDNSVAASERVRGPLLMVSRQRDRRPLAATGQARASQVVTCSVPLAVNAR